MQHYHLLAPQGISFKCLVSNFGLLAQTQHIWCCYKNKISLFNPAGFSYCFDNTVQEIAKASAHCGSDIDKSSHVLLPS